MPTTAAQFQYQLNELMSQVPTGENKAGLEEARNRLAEMEQAVNMEMHILRGQYQARLASVNAGASTMVNLPNKRGRQHAHEVERIEAERDEKLGPYQEVKTKIEESLKQLDARQGGAAKA